jgi:pyridoxal phosphate enzyme (YggS family)
MTGPLQHITANLVQVKQRIADAAERSGRSPEEVTLVAITKTFGPDYLQTGYELGLRHFGENRVAEAAQKLPPVTEWLGSRERPTWHMVGHLQRRKVGDALRLFDLIHSVDSLRLAERIDRLWQGEEHRPMPVLLEVNTSGEEQKYGFLLHRFPEDSIQWAEFLSIVERILRLPGVEVQGLMTMAPWADPEAARPCFRRLRHIRVELARLYPETDWRELSMGMTNDFEVAVEEGATMVRLGRAIFGPREEG